jgi:hypothetical protein
LIPLDPNDRLLVLAHTVRRACRAGADSKSRRSLYIALSVVVLAPALTACDGSRRSRPARDNEEASAPYQAEVEEGLGAAVAILVDTSGSMKDEAPGDSRPKAAVAREALEAMFDATEAFVAKRPGFAMIGANSGPELRKALDEIYQGRILAEASALGEHPDSR